MGSKNPVPFTNESFGYLKLFNAKAKPPGTAIKILCLDTPVGDEYIGGSS